MFIIDGTFDGAYSTAGYTILLGLVVWMVMVILIVIIGLSPLKAVGYLLTAMGELVLRVEATLGCQSLFLHYGLVQYLTIAMCNFLFYALAVLIKI